MDSIEIKRFSTVVNPGEVKERLDEDPRDMTRVFLYLLDDYKSQELIGLFSQLQLVELTGQSSLLNSTLQRNLREYGQPLRFFSMPWDETFLFDVEKGERILSEDQITYDRNESGKLFLDPEVINEIIPINDLIVAINAVWVSQDMDGIRQYLEEIGVEYSDDKIQVLKKLTKMSFDLVQEVQNSYRSSNSEILE